MRAATYARVSTQEQADTGTSLTAAAPTRRCLGDLPVALISCWQAYDFP